MRIVRRCLAVCLAVLLTAPVAQAQNHVIDKSALDDAVKERLNQQQGDRTAIISLLRHAEVRNIAAKAGISLEKAEAAVSLLQEDDLRELAEQSRQVQNDLAGSASNIVISTTTIIIVLLLIVLIVALAD